MSRKVDISYITQKAKNLKGECLEICYLNSSTKMKWRCDQRHIFDATWNQIQQGKWCSYCYGSLTYDIEELKRFAQTKGGECLSSSYKAGYDEYRWKCHKGHTWKATWNNIRNGTWCDECFKESLHYSIEEINESVKEKNIECISSNYIDSITKLKWRCTLNKNHIFEETYAEIKLKKIPCKICRQEINFLEELKRKNMMLERAKKAAQSKGGKCISTSYVKANKNLKWVCDKKHIFNATWNQVRDGSWCKECNQFKKKRRKNKLFE